MEVPTRTELRKLKVVELRQRLSALSLPQSGIKETLITRLIEHYEEEQQKQEQQPEPPLADEEGSEGKDEAMLVSIEISDGMATGGEPLPPAVVAREATPPDAPIVTPSEEPEAVMPSETPDASTMEPSEKSKVTPPDAPSVTPSEEPEAVMPSETPDASTVEKSKVTPPDAPIVTPSEEPEAVMPSETPDASTMEPSEKSKVTPPDAPIMIPSEEHEATPPDTSIMTTEVDQSKTTPLGAPMEEPAMKDAPVEAMETEVPDAPQTVSPEEGVSASQMSPEALQMPREETDSMDFSPTGITSIESGVPIPPKAEVVPAQNTDLPMPAVTDQPLPTTDKPASQPNPLLPLGSQFASKPIPLLSPASQSLAPANQPTPLLPPASHPTPLLSPASQPAPLLSPASQPTPLLPPASQASPVSLLTPLHPPASQLLSPVSQPTPLISPTSQSHPPKSQLTPLLPPASQSHPPKSQPTPLLPPVNQSTSPIPPVSQPAPLPPLASKPLPLMTKPTNTPQDIIQAAVSSDYYSASDSGSMKEYERSTAVVEDRPSPAARHSRKKVQPAEAAKEKGPRQKKKKKKKRRRRKHDQPDGQQGMQETAAKKEPDAEIEYIQEDLLKPGDPSYRQFHKILEAFRIPEPEELAAAETALSVSQLVAQAAEKTKNMALQDLDSSSDEEKDNEEKQMSKKKLRKLNRLTVAQLKQLVERPDVVEMHDVTAMDPKLLIHLKSTRNTVAVPRHWCFKRKYLQGKRGIEKPPFDLPDFIKATGVMEMRQALEDKEDAKSLKQKTRERVRPKMGKLTIDYQKLHDAFFKWQTKPKMSIHGDMYYEGKEFETRLRQKKPGDLSDELRRALGMPSGLGKHKFPPPWLVAMQRYGPPPSYPNLKIPGLNAPIPENTSFGYFVGGWGKPPVDEIGRPLYGDVFGLEKQDVGQRVPVEEEVDKTVWGELESEEEEEEEEDEESDEEGSPKPDDLAAGLVTPMEGLVTPSGLTSIPAGLETPDMIQLRKKKIEEAMEQGGETPALYTVIPEKTAAVGGAMMGSSHVYDVNAAPIAPPKKANAVDVALDPSELDLDTATIAARYEEQVREKRNAIQKEDLSDMVAEHAAKQKKRKRAATDSGAGGKAAKKLKEFKF